jgi:hypothetical protein
MSGFALSGLVSISIRFPGRWPGLLNFAPLGRRTELAKLQRADSQSAREATLRIDAIVELAPLRTRTESQPRFSSADDRSNLRAEQPR